MLFSSVDQQTRDKEPELFIRADRFAFYDLTDLLYIFHVVFYHININCQAR